MGYFFIGLAVGLFVGVGGLLFGLALFNAGKGK